MRLLYTVSADTVHTMYSANASKFVGEKCLSTFRIRSKSNDHISNPWKKIYKITFPDCIYMYMCTFEKVQCVVTYKIYKALVFDFGSF